MAVRKLFNLCFLGFPSISQASKTQALQCLWERWVATSQGAQRAGARGRQRGCGWTPCAGSPRSTRRGGRTRSPAGRGGREGLAGPLGAERGCVGPSGLPVGLGGMGEVSPRGCETQRPGGLWPQPSDNTDSACGSQPCPPRGLCLRCGALAC